MFKTKLKTTNYSKYTEIYFPSSSGYIKNYFCMFCFICIKYNSCPSFHVHFCS